MRRGPRGCRDASTSRRRVVEFPPSSACPQGPWLGEGGPKCGGVGRRLPSNPAAGVELPRLPKVHKRYLTHEQVGRLTVECGPEGVVVLNLAYTGVRWGELAALRVGRVATGVRRVHIAEAMTEVNGRAIFGPPKIPADRWIAIPAFLRDDIAALLIWPFVVAPRGFEPPTHGLGNRCSIP